jgi:hypothetical protein
MNLPDNLKAWLLFALDIIFTNLETERHVRMEEQE